MKVACLQFAPEVGKVPENIARAEAVLAKTSGLSNINWLVLPEMAFTGYNFHSLEEITPCLEPTTSGISTQWAIRTARKYNCHVTVGYPEITVPPEDTPDVAPVRYNSTVTVAPSGDILNNYRKSFLYYTDETWSSEGPGFYSGKLGHLGQVTLGICMDINPYKFLAPWRAFEFANAVISSKSTIACMSMAWLSTMTPEQLMEAPQEPDVATIGYWVERFQLLVEERKDEPVFLIIANRCGVEKGAVFAGSSTVLKIQGGKIGAWPSLGKAVEGCLVVDLDGQPPYMLSQTSAY